LLGPLPVLDARWLTHPIFVLGTDDASLLWLTRNQSELRRLRAVGLVFAAESGDAFKRIQRVAQDVPVAPGPDQWLEGQMIAAGVTVLPVLIQIDGVAVQWLQGAAP
jgi:integrating conjugative element protein (TIGR03765 family)